MGRLNSYLAAIMRSEITLPGVDVDLLSLNAIEDLADTLILLIDEALASCTEAPRCE
jgi:hypothetical protein